MHKRKWEEFMGGSFQENQDEPVIIVGDQWFTKKDLTEKLHCGHYLKAARILNNALMAFNAESFEALIETLTLEKLFSIRGVGTTTAYVWLCIVEYLGYDPEKWMEPGRKVNSEYAKISKNRRYRRKRRVSVFNSSPRR